MNLIRLCKIDSNVIYFLENFVNLFLLSLFRFKYNKFFRKSFDFITSQQYRKIS